MGQPIGVNLTSNPVTEWRWTIKPRSALAPLKKGGTGNGSKSPFLRGIWGDLDSGKNEIYQGFQAIVDTNGANHYPTSSFLSPPNATPAQRQKWQVCGRGQGIH